MGPRVYPTRSPSALTRLWIRPQGLASINWRHFSRAFRYREHPGPGAETRDANLVSAFNNRTAADYVVYFLAGPGAVRLKLHARTPDFFNPGPTCIPNLLNNTMTNVCSIFQIFVHKLRINYKRR